ncbi:hypothetical protein Pedsa_0664 [Pseudopedobacter saltans DSM 12145]|uniref:Uncharacterized protein n=1 Tax=Pseudopedobacter saltans (strain ATCC 51119 / DSM 12145 / JCM 21818 / CCUG 39354 / LMG 10337 / NBRC 100064 / NCIMB 13643) TaxID=762903 RepID=F0S819_PSESL|nr:hypothetical protein [Pseudopedobacter saltans]ADY51240.1 hypothetical protein Pedsa_0664 [Pseudopedobacter saltans DSM 12145]
MENLVGISPEKILPHGPSKTLVDDYHWHEPKVGIVASYSPKEIDVRDHFGIFRGVDQIESFAQATIVSCATFLEAKRQNRDPLELLDDYIPAFISIGQVNFLNYLEVGDTFVCLGKITFFKFRQMVCDGRIYKVPKGLDLKNYFKDFDENKLSGYDLREDFVLVAKLFDITGRALKKQIFNK